MTPDEEEELDARWAKAMGDEEPPPPRPDRRPPYAVAYSVQGGHLYEVLVPGDATVVAEDGVLKIAHGVPELDIDPVLGITYIRPVTARAVLNKENDADPEK